jgi:hypothetical protein
VVIAFLSPLLAMTVTPGTGSVFDLTIPWCSDAYKLVMAAPAAVQTQIQRLFVRGIELPVKTMRVAELLR